MPFTGRSRTRTDAPGLKAGSAIGHQPVSISRAVSTPFSISSRSMV
jgi:hypothetical protein